MNCWDVRQTLPSTEQNRSLFFPGATNKIILMLKVVAALNAFYYLCNALSIQDGSALIISILHTPTHPWIISASLSHSLSLSSVCHFTSFVRFVSGDCVALSVCLLTLSTCSGFVLSVTSHITKQASCQKTYLALVIQEGWHQLGKTRQDGGSTSIFISSTYKWDWVLGSHLLMNLSLSRVLCWHHFGYDG